MRQDGEERREERPDPEARSGPGADGAGPEESAAAADGTAQPAPERIREPVFRSDRLIFPDPEVEVIKAGQYISGGWLHSPAYLELFANTDRRLTRVAHRLGMVCRKVQRVRAARPEGSKAVYIWPTHSEDPRGIQVYRYKYSAWINLVTLLAPAGLTVQTGYRERYEVTYSEPEDDVYPALKLDLSIVLERRRTGRGKAPEPPGEQQPERDDPPQQTK